MSWMFYTASGAAKNAEYIGSEFPIGTIVSTGGTTAPTNWLFCDGTAVSRTTYSELFNVIGTFYGSGDGSSTFNVPDASGSIIYAKSLATRITSGSLGSSGGGSSDAADSSFALFMGA